MMLVRARVREDLLLHGVCEMSWDVVSLCNLPSGALIWHSFNGKTAMYE